MELWNENTERSFFREAKNLRSLNNYFIRL